MEQIASIAAPIATSIAALIVASNLGARVTGYGFVLFSVGSVAWAALGYVTDQPNLLWQNVVLTALNLFGIWRWLGRQSRIEEGAANAAQASEDAPGESLFPASLLGKATIAGGDGDALGSCVDAMIGCRSGRIRYIVASEGGVAGVGETLRRLDWTDVMVEEERMVTTLSAADLYRLPAISKDDWPDR